jgi:phosphate transport system substrate-binding protein
LRGNPLRTILTLLLGAGILVAGSGPALAGPAALQAAGLAATVNPSSGLVDSQIVDVAWSGFTANAPVYVRLCKTGASSDAQCTVPAGDLDHFTATSTGDGIVRYIVAEKSFGAFQCDDTHTCAIAVLESPTDITGGTIVPIAFAHPPGACAASSAPPVAGEGASPAAYTMYSWENAACQLASHVNVTYTNDNSFDGMSGFVGSSPNANFAVTGVPLASAQAAQLTAAHRGFAYAPLSLTSLSIAYNIVDQNGNQVTNLVLTPQILAEIASGQLSTFDCPKKVSDTDCVNLLGGDPEIRRLNPGIKFPDGSIQFFIRADHSASNLAFTSWLTATAPSIWTYGTTTTWPPPDPHPCPTCPSGTEGEANTAVAVGIPATYSATNVYIGAIDSTYAAINDLPVASIENPGQPAGVAPTASSLASALADGTANADGTITPKYDTSNPTSYPLPMLTYAIVPTTQRWPNFTAADGTNLAGFLAYAATAGQSALPSGSFPLPTSLAAVTQAVAKKIPTTEPATGGGHHHHHHHQSGGGNNTGTGGTTTPVVGSGGPTTTPPPSTTPPTTPVGKTPKPSKPAYTLVGGRLSSPVAGKVVPALAALALVGIVFGPALLLFSRGRSALAGGSLRGRFGRSRRTGSGATP